MPRNMLYKRVNDVRELLLERRAGGVSRLGHGNCGDGKNIRWRNVPLERGSDVACQGLVIIQGRETGHKGASGCLVPWRYGAKTIREIGRRLRQCHLLFRWVAVGGASAWPKPCPTIL